MITVVSSWDARYQPLADITIPNREAYCRLHGYTAVSERLEHPGGRTAIWGRLWLALALIGRCDWMWLFDLDAVVTNPSIRLETLLDTDADLLVASDIQGVNTGSVFVRRSEWSAALLRRWWDVGGRFKGWTCEEQTCLAHILYQEPKDKWAVLPQRACNSYRYELYDVEHPAGQYQDGDFVLHLPAVLMEKRLAVFRSMTSYASGTSSYQSCEASEDRKNDKTLTDLPGLG